jgi:hypothetical protein
LKVFFVLAVVILSQLSESVYGEPSVLVQSVQMPAWLLRDNGRQPLAVGMQLENNDQLITGQNSRVLLKSADGSSVKLGENATMTISNIAQLRDNQPLFTAFLTVAKGAFRFTTSTLAKLVPRDITIHVSLATIGIRGTDVWGKDGEDKGVVCLIEGKISVTGENKNEFTMDQPLSVYEMPNSLPPKPVGMVDPVQLKKWALETEITKGKGAAIINGKWSVILLKASNQTEVLAAFDTWSNAGYAVRIVPIIKDGSYELRISQLPNHSEANSLAKSLTGLLGATAPVAVR